MHTWSSAILGLLLALAATNGLEPRDDTGQVPIQQHSSGKVCMDELGCFEITSDFKHLLYRPINVLPHKREVINTKFLLYTPDNPIEADRLRANDDSSILESKINKDLPTRFIVHGFMDSELYGPWMVGIKDQLLLKDACNVIITDWSGGNKPPYYQASSNTRVVGAEMALMLEALERVVDIKPENCHIIGHSLGAHIAGYAGTRQPRLGRITALDPAEPYFQNMPKTVRLDPADAQFVDVIHSDATTILLLGLGMSQLVGHLDFFPNNGRNQPGCKTGKITSFITDGLNEGTRRFVSCNHQRSVDFFHFSVNYQSALQVAYECKDYDTFLKGKCTTCGPDGSQCAIMGLRAEEYRPLKNDTRFRTMYVKTSGSSPFWLYHYHVVVKLYKASGSSNQKGKIQVTLNGKKNDLIAELSDGREKFTHGNSYVYLVTTPKDLGTIRSVTMEWESGNLFTILRPPKLFVESITVTLLNGVEKSPRNMTGRVFCGGKDKPIKHKTLSTFIQDDNC